MDREKHELVLARRGLGARRKIVRIWRGTVVGMAAGWRRAQQIESSRKIRAEETMSCPQRQFLSFPSLGACAQPRLVHETRFLSFFFSPFFNFFARFLVFLTVTDKIRKCTDIPMQHFPYGVFQGYRFQGNVCDQIFLRFIQGHQANDRPGQRGFISEKQCLGKA